MKKLKKQYVSPKVEVHLVELEGNVTVQSPINKVNVKDWEPEEVATPDTGDIYLAI